MNKPESMPNQEGSMLILDYMGKYNLPEVVEEKVEKMEHHGYAVEYKNGEVVQHSDIIGIMTDPENPPVAVSYLGTGENPRDKVEA